jgi:general secretion pathway protein M
MSYSPTPRERRIAAILLLLAALALAYFLLLHWWWVAPLRQIDARMDELQQTHASYAAAIADQPRLERRLAAQGAGQAASSAFLPESDTNTAAAGLMQRVVDAVAAQAANQRCVVSQKMPISDPPAARGEPYRKAAARVSLSCAIEPLAAVLHALEQGTPYLFVDELNIYRNPVAVQQDRAAPLEVQFTVSGYLRPARAAAQVQP